MFLKSTMHQTTKCSFYKILPMKNIDEGMMEWWSIIKFTRLTWTSHVVILIKPKLQFRYFFVNVFFYETKMGLPMCQKTHKNCTFASFKDVRFSLLKRDVKWPVFNLAPSTPSLPLGPLFPNPNHDWCECVEMIEMSIFKYIIIMGIFYLSIYILYVYFIYHIQIYMYLLETIW